MWPLGYLCDNLAWPPCLWAGLWVYKFAGLGLVPTWAELYPSTVEIYNFLRKL